MNEPTQLLSESDIREQAELAADEHRGGRLTDEQYLRRLRFLALARALITTNTDEQRVVQ